VEAGGLGVGCGIAQMSLPARQEKEIDAYILRQ